MNPTRLAESRTILDRDWAMLVDQVRTMPALAASVRQDIEDGLTIPTVFASLSRDRQLLILRLALTAMIEATFRACSDGVIRPTIEIPEHGDVEGLERMLEQLVAHLDGPPTRNSREASLVYMLLTAALGSIYDESSRELMALIDGFAAKRLDVLKAMPDEE
jgi:hypothetical protein